MKKKQFVSLLLALVMVFSLAVPAVAAEETATGEGQIVILHTNDVHCGIDQVTDEETGAVTHAGYAGVAGYKAAMEAQYGVGNVTLVDAGDAIQGGPIGTLSKGSYIVDIMSKVGYDLAIPGNHEFDYGMDNFLSLAKEKAEYTYLCANFTDLAGKSVLDSYKVLTYGDVKVGYVGIDTPESFTKSTPTYFQDAEGNYIYSFSQGNNGADLYAAVQKAVDAAKAEGAQYVVAIAHLGIDEQSKPWTSTDVIANTTGIDVLLDGHSHSTFEKSEKNKDGKDVVVAQTGTKLANLGKIVIDTKTGKITNELVPAADCATQDADALAFITSINEQFEEVLNKVVAKTDVALTTKDPATGNRAVRSAETNLGDLCADAYREMLGADVAFVNGGGVRADIDAGDITYENIINVHPFGNEACLVKTNGQDILDALEMGARVTPGENGGFLQVSGLTYDIDTTIPSGVVLNDEKEFVKVEGARRVVNAKINGKAIDPAGTYTLASHNYMLKSGGDGFVMFKDDEVLKDCVMIDNQVLINYIVDHLAGVVGAEYADPKGQGRINVKYVGLEGNTWYTDYAKDVMDKGLMTGTQNGFEGTAMVTRATVFQTLYNLAGKPEVTNKMATFPDAQGKWYENAARWAEQMELTTGTGEGKFDGDKAVTRAEIATILHRHAQLEEQDVTVAETADLSAYVDAADVAGWAADAFKWATSAAVIGGKDGSRLAPGDTATRGELAKMLSVYTDLVNPVQELPKGDTLTAKAASISKYGNVTTDLTIEALTAAGFATGDILSVAITGQEALSVPYGTGYSNVDQGSAIALADGDTQTLALAINRGDFATTYGLGVKGEDGSWTIAPDAPIDISMGEKGGYADELAMRDLDSKRTNNREDYSSDEVFANFRMIQTKGIAEGVLYRTSSPINPELGRNTYADKLIEKAGVKTIVNMADCANSMKEYEGYNDTYYSKQNIVGLNMGVDMYSEEALGDLKNGLEFMAENKGPYAIHCTEGKDRAGYFAFLLEALMGASLREIVGDYMKSYENYYFVVADSEQWSKIAESNIEKDVLTLTGATDIFQAGDMSTSGELQAAAEKYVLEKIGLSQENLDALKANLSTPIK